MFEAGTRSGGRGPRLGGGSEGGPEDVAGLYPATPVGGFVPTVDAPRIP